MIFSILLLCSVALAQTPDNRLNTANPAAPLPNVPGASNTTFVPSTNTTNATNNTADLPANFTAPAANFTNSTLNATTIGNCKVFCKRKEIRQLSTNERNKYFGAVKKLHSGPSPTKYDQLVKKHLDATEHAHSTAYFLPWHRGYLREYEKALQEIDPTVCVPYWNWSVDSQAPENSPVFSEDYYGTNGGSDGCVQDGYFKGWQVAYPSPHCLRRKWKYGDNLGAFHSYEGVNKIVTSSTTYDQFRSKCETLAHPTPHVNIGGDMAEMHSPNDPLFWSHHAYVDYIYTNWQKSRGSDFNGPSDKGGKAQKSDRLLGFDYTVEQVFDNRQLCYEYAELSDQDLDGVQLPASTVQKPDNGKKPDMVQVDQIPTGDDRYAPHDRSNLNIIRYPDEADEEWCKKNKYDVNYVRQYETEHKKVYKQLNEIKGYVSPCSLWKRPTLCAPLIKKKKDLCVDIPDYGRVKVDYNKDADAYQAYSNVKKRVEYCSPDVEYPPEKYRATVENLVGKSAFDSAGALKKINTESDVKNTAFKAATTGALGVCLAAAAVGGLF